MSRYVKIYYGPYDAFDTTSHKPQKLRGVRDKLRRLGYRVDLVPVDHIDYCVFEMIGHEVFRCNIKNLQFNAETEHDPVSRRAVEACVAASGKFKRARTHFWFWTLLEDSVFKRSEYAPKDHWPFEVDFPQFASCKECIDCCGILTRKKEDPTPFDYHKSIQDYLYGLSKEIQAKKVSTI